MRNLDRLLCASQRWVRARPLLYRLTLGTRLLLAVGFIPAGMVKLLGRRFTLMSPESDIGGFFETLYRSGLYWQFLGLTQVAAGLLVLWNATADAREPRSQTGGALARLCFSVRPCAAGGRQ